MDKLAQPKQLSPEETQGVDLSQADRSARRPSLKRRVKSQGDIPGPGFPLLPRRRRTGPASATIGRSPEAQEAAGATRRTLLPAVRRRSAWSLQNDDEGLVARQYSSKRAEPRVGGDGGGDGDGVRVRSAANICAIEAMLEEGGGDAYLPARARDLPEAVAILGPPRPRFSDDKRGGASQKGRPRGTGKTQTSLGYGGDKHNATGHIGRIPENIDSIDAPLESLSERGDLEPNGGGRTGRRSSKASSRSRRHDGAEERFLHPWQRALEASKKAIKSRAEEHEAALLSEKQRRSEARRAAATSKDCQNARKRVAARLGRHKQRRNRRRRPAHNGDNAARDTERPPHSTSGRVSTRFDTEGHGEGSRGCLDGEVYSCRETRQQHAGDYIYDGIIDGRDDFLHQMRDALGWARKTLTALVKRLRDREVAVDNLAASSDARTAKDMEVVRVVNGLRRRLAAFEDEGLTFGVETAAAAAAAKGPLVPASANSTWAHLRSRCEAACKSFENEFGHMIDELITTANIHPSNPNVSLSHFEGNTDSDSGLSAAGLENVQQQASRSGDFHRSADPALTASASTRSRKPVGAASFGLCRSCTVLPVARRCLDCEGSHADRDRCSSCFVREHREAPRHCHRFLRISGGGSFDEDGTGDGGDHVEPERHLGGQRGDTARAENPETRGNSSGVGARCSRCGDLAASRRCRECRVDTCAACHFLVHRSPSRRSHVTEFVGETAVAIQETLHARDRHQSGSAPARTMASGAGRNSERGEDGAGGEDGTGEGIVGPAAFGEDAAQSLAQVRRTIDAPVVRPQPRASKERASLSCDRDDGDGGSVGPSEEGDLYDEADGDGETFEEERSRRSGRAGSCGSGGRVEAEQTDDSDPFEGRGHRDADRHRGGGGKDGERYALEVLKEINEEEEEEEEVGEESAGSSMYCSSNEDTDDEGMVRTSFQTDQFPQLSLISGVFTSGCLALFPPVVKQECVTYQ